MSYLVLARKYRPQRFDEVVRQEHITVTLGNAVTTGRLAHAILFSGPRGTGKTTVARILAKCVNCAQGPTDTPCNECRSCREITAGHAADVFEIDGASNNRVENIRELRDNAGYMPAHSPYKIYIIDEVHMLSDSAFNALLKILEEPPAHVMFFFATTEPNKIPITILSRCQRHDFRLIDIDALIAHMDRICREEGIEIGTEGLTLIAREAEGSVRDSLSLLDQVLSSARGSVTTEQILDILGGIDRVVLFDISEAVFAGDTGGIIAIIDQLYERGHPMYKLAGRIIEHFRNLLLVKMDGGKETLADVPEHERNIMAAQVKDISETWLNQILDRLLKDEGLVKIASNPKIALEMVFLKILQIRPALSMDTLIEKIDLLQKQVMQTMDGPDSPGNIPGPHAGPGPETVPPPSKEEPVKTGALSRPEPTPANPAGTAPAPGMPESRPRETPSPEAGEDLPESVPDPPLDQAWELIRAMAAERQAPLGACLTQSRPLKMEGNRLEIELRSNPYNIHYANREESRRTLEECCRKCFKRNVAVTIRALAAENGTPRRTPEEISRLKDEALNHPLVNAALKHFNGKIADIKILQETYGDEKF